jgi:hypothetical protein
MGDNDFPTVMGNQGMGFLQSYLRGRQNYSQIGTDIPGRQYETEYAQEQGGPLVSEQVISSLPPAMTQDEFRQEVWNRQDRKRPEVPTSPLLKDMIKNFWGRYGYMKAAEGDDFNLMSANQGPSSPVKYDESMGGFVPNPGAGRPTNIRYKGAPLGA